MLTRLIVKFYAWLIEACLWLAVLISCIAGYRVTLPLMNALGMIPEHALAWQLAGAVVLPVLVFLSLALLCGPFLILVDIRRAVLKLESPKDEMQPNAVRSRVERKEPQM